MQFKQSGLTSIEQREGMSAGWQSCFDKLGHRLEVNRSNANEAAVRKVINDWAGAIRRGDVEAILSRHDEDILMFDVTEPMQIRGLGKYRETWEYFYSFGSPSEDLFVIEQLEISASETVAFATGLLRIGGSKDPVCRLTLGLTKKAGQWLIAHEHHSSADSREG
jgi:ketosteroid isomerase-like protein